MAKKGMKRADVTHTEVRNTAPAVPEIQGKAKHGKDLVKPIIAGTKAPSQKVYHTKPHSKANADSGIYSVLDNDLAAVILENDLSAADLQDLK